MANVTPIYKLPYPEAADVPDIAGDIQKLAQATDGMVAKLISGTWGQGSMAGYPVGRDDDDGIPIYTDAVNHKMWARPFATKRHTAPIGVYAANFGASATASYWWEWGPLIFVTVSVKRLNSDLVPPADGNIGNTSIIQLASAVPKPLGYVTAVNSIGGPIAGFYLSTDGWIRIGVFSPSGRWTANTDWTETFFYMTADKVSINV